MTKPTPCPEKDSYPNESIANSFVVYYQRKLSERPRAYCCERCGWWHLSNSRDRGGVVEYTLRVMDRIADCELRMEDGDGAQT